MELPRRLQGGLPVLSVATGSYDTATNLNRMNKEIPVDDRERAERVTEFVAGHIDFEWLKQRCDAARAAPVAAGVPLPGGATRAEGRQAHRPARGSEPRTVQAAAICQARGIARCVLLAKPEEVQAVAQAQGIVLPEGLEIIDPDLVRQRYVEPMVELRKGKAERADGGAATGGQRGPGDHDACPGRGRRPGLRRHPHHRQHHPPGAATDQDRARLQPGVVSVFMLLPDQVLVYGDCAVNPDPSASDLAEIAVQSAASAQAFGIPARVAMISYSTGDSGSGEDVDKVREATRLAREQRPDLLIDGPLQYDAAAIASVGRQKAPNSPVAGHGVHLPRPEHRQHHHKAVQRSADCVSVGPMLQGLRKPVNDLSRGALVEDIVYTIALTAIQADAQAPEGTPPSGRHWLRPRHEDVPCERRDRPAPRAARQAGRLRRTP